MQKVKNYVIIILGIMLGMSVLFNSIQAYRVVQTRHELELIRVELGEARERQQHVTDTVTSCLESVERTSSILSESAVTVKDIRRQVEEIRTSYQDMERLLRSICDSDASSNNNSLPEAKRVGE